MYHFDWAVLWQYLWPPTAFQDPLIRTGLIVTVVVSVVAQALGVILGLFAALGKMSKFVPFRVLAEAYIWYFRGTPLLVQMALMFFGLGVTHIYDFPDILVCAPAAGAPLLTVSAHSVQVLCNATTVDSPLILIIGAIQAGTLALGINEGAYMAEIVRAGIESIDPGQMEAAKSLGMTFAMAMRRIVLPQAAKVIVPPLGNEFNNMMKTTSLMEYISAGELFFAFNQINTRLFQPFELFIAASMYYLVLTTIWSVIQVRIEASLGERKGMERGPGMFERIFSGSFGKGAH